MDPLLEKAFAKETLLACKGYHPLFIDNKTSIDFDTIIPADKKKLLPEVEGNNKGVLNYTNLSVLYNTEREVPFFSAYNIDGSSKAKDVVRAPEFKSDFRIKSAIQLTQEKFYNLMTNIIEFEIGHMAANNEMAWGETAQLQSYQTFHFPNSSPQAAKLNTGLWKTLETYIIDEASKIEENKKVCVFTGPLLRNDDPPYIKDPQFKIPLLFFKVVVFPTSKGMYATGFMISHEQKMIEQKMFDTSLKPATMTLIDDNVKNPFADFKYKKVFQVDMEYLQEQTGLHFTWPDVKNVIVPKDKNQIDKIRKIKDADQAAEIEKDLRKGIAPVNFIIDEDLTTHEIEHKDYRLNIILP